MHRRIERLLDRVLEDVLILDLLFDFLEALGRWSPAFIVNGGLVGRTASGSGSAGRSECDLLGDALNFGINEILELFNVLGSFFD